MYASFEQEELNNNCIASLKPALFHALQEEASSMCLNSNDLAKLYEWKVESGKRKVVIDDINLLHSHHSQALNSRHSEAQSAEESQKKRCFAIALHDNVQKKYKLDCFALIRLAMTTDRRCYIQFPSPSGRGLGRGDNLCNLQRNLPLSLKRGQGEVSTLEDRRCVW